MKIFRETTETIRSIARLNNEAALFHMKVTETICWETTAFHVECKNTRYLSRDPIWAA